MYFDYSMHYRNVPLINVEHDNLSNPDWLMPHVQEQYVASIEARLHASTQHNNHLQDIGLWKQSNGQ